MFKDDLFSSDAPIFRAHLIWLSGPACDPTVRMLLADSRSVYEGIASWSKYHSWLSSFLDTPAPEQILGDLKRILVRNQYAILSNLTIRLDHLDIYGFQRADR